MPASVQQFWGLLTVWTNGPGDSQICQVSSLSQLVHEQGQAGEAEAGLSEEQAAVIHL